MIIYKDYWGEHISQATKKIVALTNEKQDTVQVTFNDNVLTAEPGTTKEDILQYFYGELERQHKKYVTSPESKAVAQRTEVFRQEAAKAVTEGILPFAIKDQAGWQKWLEANPDDGYGEAILRYAARWANEMEAQMSQGATLTDIADKTSHC